MSESIISSEGPSDDLAQIVGRLLRKAQKKLAVAESCTGGMISSEIVSIPGASDFFLGGIVSYSDVLKEKVLSVKPETLYLHGAVSKEVALAMARGMQQQGGADIALSVTGIAGPDGGTAEKPVGTVWIGLVAFDAEATHLFHFSGSRDAIRRSATREALDMLRKYLLGLSLCAKKE